MGKKVYEIYGNRLRVRACGLLTENESLLMVNHRSLSAADFWAPPGGGVNFGEPATTCLEREFIEETGLQIEVVEFLFGCEFIQPPLHAIELFFLVRRTGGYLIGGTDPEMEKQDQIIKEVRFMPWAEIGKLDRSACHGIFTRVNEPQQVTDLRGYFTV